MNIEITNRTIYLRLKAAHKALEHTTNKQLCDDIFNAMLQYKNTVNAGVGRHILSYIDDNKNLLNNDPTIIVRDFKDILKGGV